MSRALLLSAALCVLLAVHVHAKIETLTVDHDARRLFHIESYGFEANGHFTLNVKAFQVWYDSSQKTDKDEYNMAFVLQRSATDEGLRVEQSGLPDDKCFHELPEQEEGRVVYSMKKEFWSGKIFERDITEPGYYHLYFSNCEQFALAGFSMELTEYNLELDGKTRNFLSAGESPLPSWFFVISVAFTGLAVVWIQFLLRNRSEIRSIHHLMTVVLVLKLASVFFESFEFHYIKTTGTPHGWNIVYYIFSFMKGMMMFTVIVLIGTGWSYMKPFLTERDKQIMLAVIVVQAMVNLAAVVLDELSPGDKDFLTWRDILHLLDMVCCCFILLPIVWSIRHLKDAAEVDGKAARNVVRLKRFRKFYVLVVSYIYFTRIIVFLLGATLPFEWVWLAVVFREAASFVFYGYTGYLFRPQANNPYLELSQEEEDEGGSTKPRLFEMSPP